MPNFVPLSRSRHDGKAWRRSSSYGFASANAVVPLAGSEFGKAAAAMPIAFVDQSGAYVPVAVMSPMPGRNFFIGPAGQWLGAYVPAALRGYPFRLARVDGAEDSILCIDEDSGLVLDPDGTGEAFFDAGGNLSPATKAMLDFLVGIQRSRTLTDLAVAVLAETGLIQKWPLRVKVADQMTVVDGLFRIDEPAMAVLDDAGFLKLRKSAVLPLAYMQLLSMAQVTVFQQLDRIQQQLAPPRERQVSLDDIFSQAGDDILRFD